MLIDQVENKSHGSNDGNRKCKQETEDCKQPLVCNHVRIHTDHPLSLKTGGKEALSPVRGTTAYHIYNGSALVPFGTKFILAKCQDTVNVLFS